MKELGSDVARQPEREVARQIEDNQPTKPNPNPNHDRTGRRVVTEQTSRSSAQEIDTRFSLDCKNTTLFVERFEKDKDTDKDVDADRDRTGRPVVSGQPTGSSTQLEEVDIDFRVSGLPHAVVKQAENSRVRELVKKIESHPHRQNLQADLQQSNAYNPFGEKSKKMIQDMGGKTPYERRFGRPFEGPIFRLVPYFLRKTSQESINLEGRSYLDYSSDTRCTRVGIWKGYMLVADIVELETMDASEIY